MLPRNTSFIFFLVAFALVIDSSDTFWFLDTDSSESNTDKQNNTVSEDNKDRNIVGNVDNSKDIDINRENPNIIIEENDNNRIVAFKEDEHQPGEFMIRNDKENCKDEPLEIREQKASVIVTAKVLHQERDPYNKSLSVAKIQIKRVFKGIDIIAAIDDERPKSNSEESFNKVIPIYGIGERSICVSSVNTGDTSIFMLNLEYFGNLRICSSIIPISAYTLDRTDAAVKDIPFERPPPKKSPCIGFFCPFHASCFINETSGAPYCACLDDCSDHIISPVCGLDGKTYDNECKLQLHSCQWQRRITVEHHGKCIDPCDGVKCEGQQVCKLNQERVAVCQCEVSCDQTVAPVCGSDGMTYSNECMLRQKACLENRDITVQYPAECREDNPCTSLKCSPNRHCSIDHMGVATCVCPMPCQQMVQLVCGSDGITYDNLCELKRQTCLKNSFASLAHYGPCESQEPCRGVTCEYDAICVTRNGKPTCECPDCKDAYYDPVCGDNGIHYENLCKLHKENCEKRKKVMVEHRGLCNIGGCEKNNTVCQYYSLCESDGVTSRCVCPDHCEKTDDSVCGTDGLTYASECEMRVASCKQQVYIYIMTFGPCKTCNGVKCKYGAKCTNGKCVCPFLCPAQYEPVCASDGETYSNDCEMKRTACKKDEELEIVHQGECEDYLSSVGSGEGSGDLEDCDEASCRYGGMCKHGQDGGYRCHCSFSCDAIRSPVCGSDGVTYGNPCELQTASCEQQRPIVVQFQGACDDMDEVLCDGMPPVIDPSTGREYQCTKGSDCPYDSYCHAQFGKCCQEERLSDSNIRDCTESVFGCCRDQMTFAPGPNYAGCPDECHCNWIGTIAGAFGNTCDPVTKQCKCKPGVGGLKCDSCYPGYWGLHLIQEKGNPGCTPCNCNKIGSTREDCHQMIGKCECRDGYEGMKCERCSGSQAPIGSNGCMGQTPLPKSKKTTRHIHFDNVMPNTASKKPGSTPRPPDEYDPNMKYGRIGDICLEHSYCTIPHSHCKLAICNCDKGYIPTKENTECSAVIQSPGSGSVLPEGDDFNQCTVNPCLNQGVCELDDNLGYRCLCPLGRTGVICKQTSFFKTPSFSGESYLVLQPLGNISGDFYLDIAFHTMNRDGILLFASEKPDGTGQFISLAISDGQVEFKFDMGKGPVQIRHPQKLSQNTYHQVIAKRLGQTAMLIVDGAEQMAVMIPNSRSYIELSGDLYLGYLPKNLTFIQEKIGISLGIVGCIESLTARYMNFTRNYKLQFPSPDIIDGLDIVPCERNPCQSIPCMNQGTCLVLGTDLFECVCPKGYTGSTCDSAVDLCTHSPCHESATCGISGLGEVTCFCPEGRQGQFCEYEKLKEVVVPQFTGDSYMLIPLHSSLAKQMSIEVWFMSQTPNGMLLFATQYLSGQGDFLSLNIVDKYLEFRFDLGDGPVFIRSSQPIKVGGWHKALIQTKYQEGSLILDNGEPVKASSQGVLKELQLSGILYLGGYKNISDVPTDSNIQKNFTGALQRIYISGRQIEDLKKEAVERYHVEEYHGQPCNINPCLNGGVCVPALEKVDCRCPRQYFGKNCERVAENLEMNKPVRFDGKTYLQYFNEISEMQEAQKTNKVKLKFRTHHSNGMLLYQGRGQPASDYLTLSIVNSQVELSFNLGTWNQDSLFILRSTVYVSDGSWHSVTAERDKQYATLQVDRESPVSATAEGASTQLDTDGMLWIGGKPNLPRSLPREYSKAFKGCLGDVFIDNNELNLFKHRKGQSNTIEFCH